MQAAAIFEAASACIKQGVDAKPQIMVRTQRSCFAIVTMVGKKSKDCVKLVCTGQKLLAIAGES